MIRNRVYCRHNLNFITFHVCFFSNISSTNNQYSEQFVKYIFNKIEWRNISQVEYKSTGKKEKSVKCCGALNFLSFPICLYFVHISRKAMGCFCLHLKFLEFLLLHAVRIPVAINRKTETWPIPLCVRKHSLQVGDFNSFPLRDQFEFRRQLYGTKLWSALVGNTCWPIPFSFPSL